MHRLFLLTLATYFLVLIEPSYAYLDGASVSAVIQFLGAFVIGGAMIFRSSYATVKTKIKSFFQKNK